MTSTLSTAPTTRSKSRKTFKSPCSCLNSDCSFVVLLLFTLGFNFIIYVFSLFSFSFMCLHQLSFSLNCIFLACIHQIFMFKCVFCSFTHLFTPLFWLFRPASSLCRSAYYFFCLGLLLKLLYVSLSFNSFFYNCLLFVNLLVTHFYRDSLVVLTYFPSGFPFFSRLLSPYSTLLTDHTSFFFPLT